MQFCFVKLCVSVSSLRPLIFEGALPPLFPPVHDFSQQGTPDNCVPAHHVYVLRGRTFNKAYRNVGVVSTLSVILIHGIF